MDPTYLCRFIALAAVAFGLARRATPPSWPPLLDHLGALCSRDLLSFPGEKKCLSNQSGTAVPGIVSGRGDKTRPMH